MSNPFLDQAKKTGAAKMRHSGGKGTGDLRERAKRIAKGYADGGEVTATGPASASGASENTLKSASGYMDGYMDKAAVRQGLARAKTTSTREIK